MLVARDDWTRTPSPSAVTLLSEVRSIPEANVILPFFLSNDP